jgi:hypothetical protein
MTELLDLSQFKIYIDDKKFYDARYPMQNHWINQIMKRWWNNDRRNNN